MKLRVLTVGKTTTGWVKEGEAVYVGRIGRYVPFEYEAIPDVKATRSLTPSQQRDREGTLILDKIKPGETLVLLDERGKALTSRGFADFIARRLAAGAVKGLVMCIGGPYGFSEEVYRRADFQISLSPMTFTHEMARLLLVEQIYRAMTIINNEPYHHD